MAIKLYLEATKRKQKPTEIANAIREYGVESASTNFVTIVTTALKRLRAAGDVHLFKEGWGLSTWAPPSLRNATTAAAKPKKKKKAKTAQRKNRPETQAKSSATPASEPAPFAKAG